MAFWDKGIYCKAKYPAITVKNGPREAPMKIFNKGLELITKGSSVYTRAIMENISKNKLRLVVNIIGLIFLMFFLIITALTAVNTLEYSTY